MWNEVAERFTFYGMKAILTTYLISQFYNPENNPKLQDVAVSNANEQTHLFITLAYAVPLLGGFLSDWFLGKYKTILFLSILYCFGVFIQAVNVENYSLFMAGVFIIAIGSGGIKPNVSANLGDQFDETNEHLIPKAFNLFYFCINIGSFISAMLIPIVFRSYGAKIAFGIPGVLMLLALIVFIMGQKYYKKVPPVGYPKENFIVINGYALLQLIKGKKSETGFLDLAKAKYSTASVEGIKQVWAILGLFAFIPFFWALYDQNGSEWVLQATQLDLKVFGITFMAQQVQAINAILILVFIPFFSLFFFPLLERKGIKVNSLTKIGFGFLFTLLSFVVIWAIQLEIDAGQHPSVIWQALAYVILTIGEVLISMTGLEYAYQHAPKKMKSTISAFWLLTVSAGNYLVSLINNNIAHQGFLSSLTGAAYYLFFIVLLAIVTVLYFIYIRKINKREANKTIE